MTLERDPLQPYKIDALGAAHRLLGGTARRVVDLGGVWGVRGAYALAAHDLPGVEEVVLVDSEDDIELRQEIERRPGLRFVLGLFGDPAIAAAVGDHDITLLFDVLLHQSRPDWDEVLRTYAERTRCFVICNPQWTGGEDRLRLLDLGPDRYFQCIPHAVEEPENRALFDRLDEPVPPSGRPLRDLHNLWQWGISDRALRSVVTELGFEERFAEDHGPFAPGSGFHRRSFVFVRSDRPVQGVHAETRSG